MDHSARAPSRTSLEAVVIRADGTREDLGCIVYRDRNVLRQWLWNLDQFLRRRGWLGRRGPRPSPIQPKS